MAVNLVLECRLSVLLQLLQLMLNLLANSLRQTSMHLSHPITAVACQTNYRFVQWLIFYIHLKGTQASVNFE